MLFQYICTTEKSVQIIHSLQLVILNIATIGETTSEIQALFTVDDIS